MPTRKADETGSLLWGAGGFVAGLAFGSLGADAGAALANENYPLVLDRACAFANQELGLAALVGRGGMLELVSVQVRHAFVLEEGQWYQRRAGEWAPDRSTQTAFEQFDFEGAVRRAREVDTEGEPV